MSSVISESVFLDTQVFVSNAFDLTNSTFQALRKHVASGRLKLVLTDITVGEIRSNVRKSVEEELGRFRQAAKKARTMSVSKIADVDAAIAALSPEKVIQKLLKDFDDFLAETKPEVLPASEGDAEEVFRDYFASKPPFANSLEKKHEFPDAFVAQAITEWANDNGEKILAITGDGPLADALNECAEVITLKDLGMLVDHVASDQETISTFLRTQLKEQIDQVKDDTGQAFIDLNFYVRDEDGEASVDDTELTLQKDPEIVSIDSDDNTAVIRVTFGLSFSAELRYHDSSSGIYDSEDGHVYYRDEREERVHRKTTAVAEVTVSFTDLDSELDIIDVKLVKPAGDSFFISTEDAHGYPWK